jgi:hypothetical protein
MATLSLRKGDTFVARATFTDDVSGDPYPMSGWDISASMLFSNCPAVVLTCSWLDQPGGIAILRLPAAETATLHVGDHELQVRMTTPEADLISADPQVVRVRE